MVSSGEDKKENKKGLPVLVPAPVPVPVPAPAQPTALGLPTVTIMAPPPASPPPSARKLKKKPSQSSVDMTCGTTMDNEEEDGSSNMLQVVKSDTAVRVPDSADIMKPPPLHYVPVVVKVEKEKDSGAYLFSRRWVRINHNMVITGVKSAWAHLFMPGDQISAVNGVSVWNYYGLRREYKKIRTDVPSSLEDPSPPGILITVIRVWNYSCPTKAHLERTGITNMDDRYHYFVARLWHYYRKAGVSLTCIKKVVYVSDVSTKSDAYYGLMPGDQLLSYGDQVFTAKNGRSFKKKQNDYLEYMKTENAADVKFTDVFACRPILARTTPNPSIEAEVLDTTLDRHKTASDRERALTAPPPLSVVGGQTDKNGVIDTEELNPLLEADALEIALRELCHLQQVVKPDQPLPYLYRSRSLLLPANPPPTPPPPPAPTKPNNNTADRSVYLPHNASDTSTMGPAMQSPSKWKKWKKPVRKPNISFTENETTKITSDIGEEADLKKCDPRSGIVAYIRNAFTG